MLARWRHIPPCLVTWAPSTLARLDSAQFATAIFSRPFASLNRLIRQGGRHRFPAANSFQGESLYGDPGADPLRVGHPQFIGAQ